MHRYGHFFIGRALGLMLFLTATTAGAVDRAVPVEGEPFQAKLRGIDEQWQVTLDVAGKERNFPAEALVMWGARVSFQSGAQVVLHDGSVLRADVIATQPERVLLQSSVWGEVSVPVHHVRAMLYRPPLDELERDQLVERLENATNQQSQLWLMKGDVVDGELAREVGEAELPLFGQTELRWRVGANEIAVPLDRIAAVLLAPAPAVRPSETSPRLRLGLRDGSLLHVQGITSEEGAVVVELEGGLKLTAQDGWWDRVVAAQFAGPKIRYLSDLQDIGYKHIPFLDTLLPYGRDQNVLGGHLRTSDHIFSKGLGMHTTSRVAYQLDDGDRKFEAELALDAQAGERGSVIYRVFLNDGSAWTLAYESPIIRGGEAPVAVSVPLNGARQLALIVDYADRADELDYANWFNARLVR